jgi:hypothetical protein
MASRAILSNLALAGMLSIHAIAVAIALFHLLDWTWGGPWRAVAVTALGCLSVSALFGACSDRVRNDRCRHLLARISAVASGIFAGGVTATYFATEPGGRGVLGAITLSALWLVLLGGSRRDTAAVLAGRAALFAAGLSSYGVAFLTGAHCLAALQGGRHWWASLMAILATVALLVGWLNATASMRRATAPSPPPSPAP